jgi:hypothetical protein
MTEPRRLPAPWTIEEHPESFIVIDAKGQRLAFVHFAEPRTNENGPVSGPSFIGKALLKRAFRTPVEVQQTRGLSLPCRRRFR